MARVALPADDIDAFRRHAAPAAPTAPAMHPFVAPCYRASTLRSLADAGSRRVSALTPDRRLEDTPRAALDHQVPGVHPRPTTKLPEQRTRSKG
jgi:hypothetical protein